MSSFATKIVVCIATKNRPEFLKNALDSVLNQTYLADQILVISDSDEMIFSIEKTICQDLKISNLKLFKNTEKEFNHNYAGSLNYGIFQYINFNINEIDRFERTYFAFLDDDDTWDQNYLKKALNSIKNNEDFVVSGLNFITDHGVKKLSIPQTLNIKSFLIKNPHLQGSNTFIKLSTLLKAGCFDENFNSMVDRDFFTRLMFLKPKYAVINKHLVNVNVKNDHQRITNNKNNKIDAMKKFLYKYENLMSVSIKNEFFKNAKKLFKIERNEVDNYQFNLIDYKKTTNDLSQKIIKIKNLTFGIIISDYELGIRLIKQILSLKLESYKLVIIRNFLKKADEIKLMLIKNKITFNFIDFEEINKIESKKLFNFNKKIPNIKDIATSRTILNYYLKIFSLDGPIWIIDEDMEFYEYINNGKKLIKIPINLNNIIERYKNYDVVIGNYSQDSPVPLLSTLRTNLVDYFYFKKLKWNNSIAFKLMEEDYYYDLSDKNHKHLETPFLCLFKAINLDDLFSGKNHFRPLFNFKNRITEAKNRGGNTLIFNKKVLDYPNWSIIIENLNARRSDYFWTLYLKQTKQFKIINAPFSLFHNRKINALNIVKEEKKLLQDLIGSSFTKAIEMQIDDFLNFESEDANWWIKNYKYEFCKRLSKYIMSYFRINGLLTILNSQKYLKIFTITRLKEFLSSSEKYFANNTIKHSFLTLKRNLKINHYALKSSNFQELLEKELKTKLFFLGIGTEGIIFHDKQFVYKCFYKPLLDETKLTDFLKKIKKSSFFYDVKIINLDNNQILKYKYDKAKKLKFTIDEIKKLLRFLLNEEIFYQNFKPENFIKTKECLKIIDYGKSFAHLKDEQEKELMIRRGFELINYGHLLNDDFKKMINSWWANEYHREIIDFNYLNLSLLIKKRSKEDLHDQIVVDFVSNYSFVNVLDYGAGKCKIANQIQQTSGQNIYVFDIDLNSINQNIENKSRIISNINLNNSKFDIIICNLVLCCVNDEILEEILTNINSKSKRNTHIILSICNPFFNYVKKTEIATKQINQNFNYFEKSKITKIVNSTNKKRTDFHRPISFYLKKFKQHHLKINKTKETHGINIVNLNTISDFLVFDLSYEVEQKKFQVDNKILIVIEQKENMTNEEIKQIFSYLQKQEKQNFVIHFLSKFKNATFEYVQFLFENDYYFKKIGKIIKISNLNEYLKTKVKSRQYLLFLDPNKMLINKTTTKIIDDLLLEKNELIFFNYLNFNEPWIVNDIKKSNNLTLGQIPFLVKAKYLKILFNSQNIKSLNDIDVIKMIEIIKNQKQKISFESKPLFLLKNNNSKKGKK